MLPTIDYFVKILAIKGLKVEESSSQNELQNQNIACFLHFYTRVSTSKVQILRQHFHKSYSWQHWSRLLLWWLLLVYECCVLVKNFLVIDGGKIGCRDNKRNEQKMMSKNKSVTNDYQESGNLLWDPEHDWILQFDQILKGLPLLKNYLFCYNL